VTSAETAVAVARSSFEKVQSTKLSDFPQGMVADQISSLEGKILQLDQDLTSLRSTFGENWPEVVQKRKELVLVQDQLRREKEVVLARNIEQARLDLEAAENRHRISLTALNDQKGLVNQFHNAAIEYNILKREVDTNRNLYEGLLERLRQTGVMAGFQFGNIQVIESGRPSRNPDSPKVFWNLGLGGLLGLALALSIVILLEFWDNTVTTLEEAEQLGSPPSLGSVPLLKTKPTQALFAGRANGKAAKRALAQTNGSHTSLSPALAPTLPFELTESMRAICASLLLSRSDERPRVIVVTSATPSEGKTTLVAHLGRAFAEAGMSTLIVEADLRKQDLSKVFSVGGEDGLSLFLAGHVSPWPKIHETAIPNLFVAAGGPIPPNPAALLHSDRLTQFLKAAASDYKVVLVDSPPLSLADARILGTKADGVVLVVRAGQTAKNLVRRAWMTLEASGAKGLGMVLNGEEPDPTASPYYTYNYSQSQA
jgi:capsular exopolysaccharide synthesis family protein